MLPDAALVCDLDGTLLGDPAATQRFVDWWDATQPTFRLIYASGRLFRSILQAIRQWRLPTPDAILGGVGSEIYFMPDNRFCADWPNRWWSTWQPHRIGEILADAQDLELQPIEFQSTFKRSYYLHRASDDRLREIRWLLSANHVRADVIYSSQRDLDVLPSGVDKGTAASYVLDRWKIPRSRVVVAGDSGNDLSLFTRGYRGVIVANAHPELQFLSNTSVYRSSRKFGDGIIEGVEHWRSRGL